MNAIIESPMPKAVEQRLAGGALDPELEFLWEDQDHSGNAYDLYLGRISRNPVVRSHASGKYFMLPWSEIIGLGLQHGIGER